MVFSKCFTDNNVYRVPQLGASRLDAVAFFQIVNLEYDVVAGIEGSGHLAAAFMGELGCWIDTTVTRMMQAGVEHSFVPFVDEYYGLGTSSQYPGTSTHTDISFVSQEYQIISTLLQPSQHTLNYWTL